MTSLKDEIRQTRPFGSAAQEAHLSIARTWAVLDHTFAEALKPYGITPTQYNVLRILGGAGDQGLCRQEVIERMITRVPDATRLLDRMEAAGLIARQRSTVDRRYVATHLSAQGRRLLDELNDTVTSLHASHMSSLSEAELQVLIDLLGRIRGHIC